MPAGELEGLRDYCPVRDEPADFDQFWLHTLTEARAVAGPAVFTPIPTRLRTIETFDVSFPGYGGQPIRAWLKVPRERTEPLPAIVEYPAYGGGRGGPCDSLLFASAGYAHLVMDNRAQSSPGRAGDTPDIGEGSGSYFPGFMTRGIESPYHYYFRRLYTDAVRVVDAARSSPLIDPDQIAVTGAGQGGGMCLAVGALVPDVQAVLPSGPTMCDIWRSLGMIRPYLEITNYLRSSPGVVEAAKRTLGYFDGVHFAARATAPALFSVAGLDDGGAAAFAAYNHYQGEKDVRVWEFSTPEGAMTSHAFEQLAFLDELAAIKS